MRKMIFWRRKLNLLVQDLSMVYPLNDLKLNVATIVGLKYVMLRS